jgi:hypothetical protein
MNTRGWSSQGLPVVGDDPNLWTVAEAACHLGPPVITVTEARKLVSLFGLQPVGKRRTSPHGTSGRYARVYQAIDFIKAHDALGRHSA